MKPSDELAARLVQKLIVWFPKADPDPAWTDEAIKLLGKYPHEVMVRMYDTGMREFRSFPSIPALRALADRLNADHAERVRQASEPVPLKRSSSDLQGVQLRLIRSWLKANQSLIRNMAEHGYPLAWVSWLEGASHRGAQLNEPHVKGFPPDAWREWPRRPVQAETWSLIGGKFWWPDGEQVTENELNARCRLAPARHMEDA